MFKKSLSKRGRLAMVSLAALAVAAFGAVGLGTAAGVMHLSNHEGENKRQISTGQAEALYDAKAAAEASAQQPAAPTTDTPPAPTPKPQPVKYATSSDPRSTAYSTTPPAPHPASFSIKITHNGQLAAGDKLYYNATKGETGYYNGDLVVSPSTVTLSKSGSKSAAVTVASPTSKVIQMASTPWDDPNSYFGIGVHGTSVPAPALSHEMFIESYNLPPVGTYQFHIFASCSTGSSDGCESDAFVTVNVVD